MHKLLPILLVSFISLTVQAQKPTNGQWLQFNDLDSTLAAQPQQVLLYFYADWCTYCRKMDKEVFTKPEVIAALGNLHAVKFNAESRDTIRFEGRQFVNTAPIQKSTPLHELALALAMRNGQFTPPVLLLLDSDFRVIRSSYQYMDSKKLLRFIEGQ